VGPPDPTCVKANIPPKLLLQHGNELTRHKRKRSVLAPLTRGVSPQPLNPVE